MKYSNFLILFFSIFYLNIDAADLKVYPNALSPDFASIQDAIDAAEDGDNIYIDTAVFIGNVSIQSKAISLYPMRADGMYTINGSLTINIENNETVYIQGLSGGSCNVSYSGNGGTNNNEEWTRNLLLKNLKKVDLRHNHQDYQFNLLSIPEGFQELMPDCEILV